MNERWIKLFGVAKDTKNALYAEWKKKSYFQDCNNFYNAGQGVISEAMGLTSVMLLYNSFAEKKEVFENGINDHESLAIINTSLEYIYDTVLKDGYIVSPLRDKEETEGVIDKNNAYVDTLTWVLSSSTLVVYAIRQGILSISPELENKAIELISDSLAYLISGQLDCGAWGFSTSHDSKHSLYFTYAAAASLADFFDYILGELVYYENDDNQKLPKTDFYDLQTVNAINNYYKEHPKAGIYPTADITVVIDSARSKLQQWLLENCLPLLPKIAECTPLSVEEREMIGASQQTESKDIEALGNKDYINLYYAYYIIDILTTSNSDKRYKRIADGKDTDIELDALKKCYKKIMSASDYSYFYEVGSGKNSGIMFDDYINQSIHSARKSFSSALRSGKAFWDTNKSELIIEWKCKEDSLSDTAIGEARGDDSYFKEPALVPMALRANTVYCYYIINRADVTVDNLFELICADRSDKTETIVVKKITNEKIKDLWDNTNYSLPVTERAIESLVDYSDYLSKTIEATVMEAQIEGFSSIDDAIDKKIERYLRSEEGTRLLESKGYVHKDNDSKNDIDEEAIAKLIDSRVDSLVNKKVKEFLEAEEKANAPSVASVIKSANEAFDADMYIRELENVQHFIVAKKGLPDRDSDDYCEKLAYAFMETFKLISQKAMLESISGIVNDDEKAENDFVMLTNQLNELFELIVRNYGQPNGNIASLYRYLMSFR